MSKKVVALCFVAVLVLCIVVLRRRHEEPSKRGVYETLIAQIDAPSFIPESFRASPDRRRVAYVAQADDKQSVVVNRKKQNEYDATGGNTLIFSPDGKRVAYAARLGEKWLVVVDGKEGYKYDGIGEGTPIFSPDSQRTAYAARVGKKWLVVLDGRAGKKYDGISRLSLIFSPDSQRLAYVAQIGNWRTGRQAVVVDGEERKQYDGVMPGTITFSPDSQRLAYAAFIGVRLHTGAGGEQIYPRKVFVVIDGKEEKEYLGVGQRVDGYYPGWRAMVEDANDIERPRRRWAGGPISSPQRHELAQDGYQYFWRPDSYMAGAGPRAIAFSPDSEHAAYVAVLAESSVKRKWCVVLDGEEGKQYDGIWVGSLTFSPDSQRVAYVAQAAEKWVAVVDASEGEKYPEILPTTLSFSPDSERVAYVAQYRTSRFLVLDGEERKAYHLPRTSHQTASLFSPDSKRLAHVQFVRVPGGTDLMSAAIVHDLDDKEQKKYDMAWGSKFVFSPDSKRLAYVAAAPLRGRGEQKFNFFVGLEGEQGKGYDAIISNSDGEAIVFDSADRLHYLARKGNRIYSVEETIK